jgi:hypothetical protein
MCCCGGRYTVKNQSIHFKNKLHQNYLKYMKNIDADYTNDEIDQYFK